MGLMGAPPCGSSIAPPQGARARNLDSTGAGGLVASRLVEAAGFAFPPSTPIREIPRRAFIELGNARAVRIHRRIVDTPGPFAPGARLHLADGIGGKTHHRV